MDKSKLEQLATFLLADSERAKYLMSLSPAEATVELNKHGFQLTEDEVVEAGKAIKAEAEKLNGNELCENDLENVAGGGLRDYGNGLFAGAIIGAGIIIACACGW